MNLSNAESTCPKFIQSCSTFDQTGNIADGRGRKLDDIALSGAYYWVVIDMFLYFRLDDIALHWMILHYVLEFILLIQKLWKENLYTGNFYNMELVKLLSGRSLGYNY